MFIFDKIGKLFLLGSVIILAFIWVSQKNPIQPGGLEDEREVAKVNNYKIIVSDFATAISPVTQMDKFSPTSLEVKEKILSDLITRKVLIQEAQRQDFDKQKTFMKEIEGYWEQALLKFLLKKKAEEIASTIGVEEAEVKNEYQHRKQKVLAEVISLSDAQAALELSLSKDNFDEIKQKLADKIVLPRPAQWWVAGDLPILLEDPLFSLQPGEVSSVIQYAGGWVVIRVLKIEAVEARPLEEVVRQIKSEIAQRKQEEALEKWIAELRRRAVVKINHDVLNEIDLRKLRRIK